MIQRRPDDDAAWRRPADGASASNAPDAPSAAGDTAAPSYVGPPPSTPPPAGWQLPVVAQAPPPRQLPKQDHDGLDQQEQTARTLTYGVAMVAGSVMILLLLLICGRVLF